MKLKKVAGFYFCIPLKMGRLKLFIKKKILYIGVPSNRINELVRGRRGISADTDLRLGRYFRLSVGFWLGLQNDYDIMEANRASSQSISKIKPLQIDHHAEANHA
ncbi:MAG: HigA family addiction module antitoxin [Candidatus Puniceispirillales bacterium WSBS_2018_MAG_OTU23]